ncbi:Anaerobic sulfite reductase subunit B [Symmachiella macrocystis]|uniref:Anaerobic sulfite reductase subunit B n=1 Tax=Symmachiella macrocystis TaxID=2527985 RepID=A0A5C6BAQ5_9PLAN|nr:FAD/NAD(P)-binding protein [Symmachiella macrocystis]TWU08797.1 Anaerobic sulfite reductase subunit B [Symmachiella macrocystis]
MTGSAACKPTDPWLAYSVTVDQVTPETPGVATYDLIFTDNEVAARYTFLPGQFNMLYLPGVGEIAISISGDPTNGDRLPHTIRVAGNVTRTLAGLAEGASLGLRGPFGSSWPLAGNVGKDVILIAGGIGLAPLRPVIYELLSNRHLYGQLTLLYGSRTPEGLLYPGEYDNWRTRGLDVQTTVDRTTDGWSGNVGVVTTLLERMALPRSAETVLFTCGPEVMMWYTVQSARECGIPDENLYVSLERNMNCAVGLCGHCQFGPEFLCKDGPIFGYDRVASILKVDDL